MKPSSRTGSKRSRDGIDPSTDLFTVRCVRGGSGNRPVVDAIRVEPHDLSFDLLGDETTAEVVYLIEEIVRAALKREQP